MALRTPLSVTPHLYMGDSTGRPLDKGVVYFGEQDKDPEFYPINLFSDDALTKPLAQPVHTKGGYLYDKGDMVEPHAKELIYSVKVLDSYGRKVFYKGAMMRNSWNDDVIEQINTAIIGSADVARQVATDITNDAINNTAIEGSVLADTFVVVNGNETQAQVNSKTSRTYGTVAAMLSDVKLKSGQVVITKGYYEELDGGEARYTISSTPTDYSIPLNNGLHALFNDAFDIRRFGIRNNPTLNQTVEIERMCAYADRFVYEIDFLGFHIQVPKTRTMTTQWGIKPYGGVMAMRFAQAHKIKNLTLSHDKTVQLQNCMCMILFAPLRDAPYEQWFKLENVTFDAWVDNYQKYTDNYLGNGDGFRHGFISVPQLGAVGIEDSQITPCNYSFEFTNIHFSSPAYSYNLIPALHARNIKFNNLSGEYIGLYLLHICQRLVGSNMEVVYRDDLLETNREVVRNAIHAEAEYGGKKNHRELIDVSNISSIKKTTGAPWSAFVFMDLGVNEIDRINFNDMQGFVGLYGETTATNVNYFNCQKPNGFVMAGKFKISDTLHIKNWILNSNAPSGSFGNTAIPIWNPYIKKLLIEDSDIGLPLSADYIVGDSRTIDEIVFNRVRINSKDDFMRDNKLSVKHFELNDITITNEKAFIVCKFETANIKNITFEGAGSIYNIIENSGVTRAKASFSNLYSERKEVPYRGLFYGNLDVDIKNSYFSDRISMHTADVGVKAENTQITSKEVYDPILLEKGIQSSKSFYCLGANIGDTVAIAFNLPLQGTRMWGEVHEKNNVNVYHRNDSEAAVDLPSGILTIKIN